MATMCIYIQDRIKRRLDELPKTTSVSRAIKKFLKAWIERGCPDPSEFNVYIRSNPSKTKWGEDDE